MRNQKYVIHVPTRVGQSITQARILNYALSNSSFLNKYGAVNVEIRRSGCPETSVRYHHYTFVISQKSANRMSIIGSIYKLLSLLISRPFTDIFKIFCTSCMKIFPQRFKIKYVLY